VPEFLSVLSGVSSRGKPKDKDRQGHSGLTKRTLRTVLSAHIALKAGLCAAILLVAPVSHSPHAAAQSSTAGAPAQSRGAVTGLPTPRFVSLKSNRVNVRRGPSRSHQVEWVFVRAGLPVEVIAEFDNWRRVRDHEGDEGWVFHTLLSGRRTALVAPWDGGETLLPLQRQPRRDTAVMAQLSPRVLVDVETCESGWCRVAVDEARGWIEQTSLWGVYPDELVE